MDDKLIDVRRLEDEVNESISTAHSSRRAKTRAPHALGRSRGPPSSSGVILAMRKRIVTVVREIIVRVEDGFVIWCCIGKVAIILR